jgi:hypothetical protein
MKIKLNTFLLYLIIALLPIIINYGLLTWRMPGVITESNPWLAFLGSYLGFIGAISIALMNTNNQQKRNDQIDKESRRSFVVVNDFTAPLTLHNVSTHENSRLIETENYTTFLENNKDNKKDINITFLKLAHFGNSEVILDCHIEVDYKVDTSQKTQNVHINVNIGIVEKGIEIFIPLIIPEIQEGDNFLIDVIKIEYKTLMNEKLRYVINHENNTEYYSIINKDGKPTPLFELDNTSGSTWIYPQKLTK